MKKHILIGAIALIVIAFIIFLLPDSKSVNTLGDPHFTDDGCPTDSIELFEPKDPSKVTLYVETSGSMNGFFRANQSNRFKKSVWSVFTGLEPLTDGNVYPMSNGGDIDSPVSLAQFRTTMNGGGFVANTSTRIPDMLANIIGHLNIDKGEAAVLVSDMKYSPMGRAQAPMLANYQEDIRNLIGRTGVSIAFVCAVSEYLGPNNQVKEAESPYCFIIIGKSDQVAALYNAVATWVDSAGGYVDSGLLAMDYKTPLYELRSIENGSKSHYNPNTLILDATTEYTEDTVSFVLRIDMRGFAWGAVEPEVVDTCLIARGRYGATVTTALLDLKDDHQYRGRLERRAYADYLVKVCNWGAEGEVVEWQFNHKPLQSLFSQRFLSMATNSVENDLTGLFSFEDFIAGVFNGGFTPVRETPQRILISPEPEAIPAFDDNSDPDNE
jgi:hypothetical protein